MQDKNGWYEIFHICIFSNICCIHNISNDTPFFLKGMRGRDGAEAHIFNVSPNSHTSSTIKYRICSRSELMNCLHGWCGGSATVCRTACTGSIPLGSNSLCDQQIVVSDMGAMCIWTCIFVNATIPDIYEPETLLISCSFHYVYLPIRTNLIQIIFTYLHKN